jgi:hypothetical protein
MPEHVQRDVLLVEKHWMLGPEEEEEDRLGLPIPNEWETTLALVGRLTSLELHVLDACRLRTWPEATPAERAGRMRLVGNFTQSINAADAIAAGCPRCFLCDDTFSDEDGEDLERPVKTICGHVVGKQCLQKWTNILAA